MRNHVDRAAEVIDAAIESEPHERRLYPDLYAGKVAQALAGAGLLASEEHDAAVAERADRAEQTDPTRGEASG